MDTFLAVACMLQSRAINRSWAEKFLIILNLMKCFFLFYFFISELFHFEGTDWSKCETYSITVALLSQSWLHDRQVRYLLCKCRPCSIALPNEEGGWAGMCRVKGSANYTFIHIMECDFFNESNNVGASGPLSTV